MASLIHEPERPRKPWRVTWYERGRHRTKRFPTRREAEAFIGEVARGGAVLSGATAALSEWWETWLTEIPMAARTRRDRAWYGDKHVLPHLGHLRIRELTREDVRRWRTAMARAGASEYTINTATTILSAALGEAVKEGHLVANPATGHRKLKRVVDPVQPPAVLEVEVVRQRLGNPRDRLAVSLLAYAGLRPGELCALTWQQLAAVAAPGGQVAPRLDIRRARSTGGVKGTKTNRGRSVELRTPVLEDLYVAVAARGEQVRGADGSPVVSEGWDNWTGRVWRPALREVGLVGVRPYWLRHLCASLLIQEGRLSLPEIAAHLGHSLPMLLATYSHIVEGQRGRAGRPLEEVVLEARRAVEHQPVTGGE